MDSIADLELPLLTQNDVECIKTFSQVGAATGGWAAKAAAWEASDCAAALGHPQLGGLLYVPVLWPGRLCQQNCDVRLGYAASDFRMDFIGRKV